MLVLAIKVTTKQVEIMPLEVGGGNNVPTMPNCKLFTCQLALVAAAPVLQEFHPGEKWGGAPCPPPGSYGPVHLILGCWRIFGQGMLIQEPDNHVK